MCLRNAGLGFVWFLNFRSGEETSMPPVARAGRRRSVAVAGGLEQAEDSGGFLPCAEKLLLITMHGVEPAAVVDEVANSERALLVDGGLNLNSFAPDVS